VSPGHASWSFCRAARCTEHGQAAPHPPAPRLRHMPRRHPPPPRPRAPRPTAPPHPTGFALPRSLSRRVSFRPTTPVSPVVPPLAAPGTPWAVGLFSRGGCSRTAP
jgi:hypothetical protein